MDLFIDTTEQNKIQLQILDGSRVISKFSKSDIKISENLLPMIEKFLKKHKLKLSDLDMVRVNPGPGGFSSTRTGVSTANALNFALGRNEIVLPRYDKLPNITTPKSKFKNQNPK